MPYSKSMREEEMKKNGTFNHHSQKVCADVFNENPFFDPHDIMQVKYEMLRAVEKGDMDVSAAAEAFGFSRVSFYQVKNDYEQEGVVGLMPQKRGPRGSRKITDDDVDFARKLVTTHTKDQIVCRLREERGVNICKRTLERKLLGKKNGY
jgi:transposase